MVYCFLLTLLNIYEKVLPKNILAELSYYSSGGSHDNYSRGVTKPSMCACGRGSYHIPQHSITPPLHEEEAIIIYGGQSVAWRGTEQSIIYKGRG